MSHKLYHVTLTCDEQVTLQKITSSRKATSQVAQRAFALLACDENGSLHWTDEQVKKAYNMTTRTVHNLRQRFIEEPLHQVVYGKKREKFKEKS